MLVIDDQGNNLGKMNKARALKEAEDRNLDLVVVSPDSKVVVAKMMDYSKHRYEQQKKLREMKKNQQTVDIKEIRLSPIIGVHDFNTKLNHAKKFISKGDKVKLTLRFRGRMIQHKELGAEIVDKFISELGESIIIESKPKLEGFQIIAVIAPNNN
jgi:translation initiation factor IF-3